MKLYIVNNNSELLDILNKYEKVIINISAPWCKYCVKILPQSLTYFENIKVNNCAFVYLNKDKFKKLYKLLKLVILFLLLNFILENIITYNGAK